jgi:hypothetical protein
MSFQCHGPACPGHPRLLLRLGCKDVDARDKRGHDGAVRAAVEKEIAR